VLNTFFDFSSQALQFLLVEWFKWVSIGIFIVLSIAVIATVTSPAARSRPITSFLFPLLLFVAFPLTFAIAILFPAPAANDPNRIGVWLLNGLEFLSVAFAIYCIYRSKGIRLFAAALVIAELWVIFVAGLVAGVAMSGDAI
jgi:hypothetical protein